MKIQIGHYFLCSLFIAIDNSEKNIHTERIAVNANNL